MDIVFAITTLIFMIVAASGSRTNARLRQNLRDQRALNHKHERRAFLAEADLGALRRGTQYREPRPSQVWKTPKQPRPMDSIPAAPTPMYMDSSSSPSSSCSSSSFSGGDAGGCM